MKRVRIFLPMLALAFCLAGASFAAGPVDGEFGAVWWANDFEAQGVSEDAGAPGYRAELWALDRYGFRATRYSSDLDDLGLSTADSSDYTSVDLMWKALAPTENNYLAVGLGWEEVDLAILGMGGDTSGMRVSVEGRVSLVGMVYGYGHASYLPSLDDARDVDPAFTFEEMDGIEYEVGVSWKAAPFVSVRAGYRENTIDYSRVDLLGAGTGGSAESTGFLLGLGVHF